MNESALESLKFPVGRFQRPAAYNDHSIQSEIEIIERLPRLLTSLLMNVSKADLNKTYRPEGWTVNQVVNHMADSHMNAFVRFKLALTEDQPTIKPYLQDAWVQTPEIAALPIHHSLSILAGLHARWATLLTATSHGQLARTVFHPEQKRQIPLFEMVAMYAWHSRHHTAHIKIALGR